MFEDKDRMVATTEAMRVPWLHRRRKSEIAQLGTARAGKVIIDALIPPCGRWKRRISIRFGLCPGDGRAIFSWRSTTSEVDHKTLLANVYEEKNNRFWVDQRIPCSTSISLHLSCPSLSEDLHTTVDAPALPFSIPWFQKTSEGSNNLSCASFPWGPASCSS